MKPKLLNLAFQSPLYQAPNLALHSSEGNVGAWLGGGGCGGVVRRLAVWGRGWEAGAVGAWLGGQTGLGLSQLPLVNT